MPMCEASALNSIVENDSFAIVELGDPRLKQVAGPVMAGQWAEALRIASIMQQKMLERDGVGIAAPQIGVSWQMLIIASRPNVRYPDAPLMEPMLLINPEPVAYSERWVKDWEGCLSVPGLRGWVPRPDAVTVSYRNAAGEARTQTFTDFPARIFLHEYDHLIGKTFLDRLASLDDLVSQRVYEQRMGLMSSGR